MAVVASMIVQIGADIADLQRNVAKVDTTLGGIMTSAKKMAATLGIAFGASEVINFTKNVVKFADELDEANSATGATIKGLQQLNLIGKTFRLNLNDITSGIQQMQKRLAGDDKSAVAAVKRLGLNVDELLSLAPDQMFMRIGSAIAKIPNHAERTNAAFEVMGRQGGKMINLLTTDVEKLTSRFQFMTDEEVKNVARWGDAWDIFLLGLQNAAGRALGKLMDLWGVARDILNMATFGQAGKVSAAVSPSNLPSAQVGHDINLPRGGFAKPMGAADALDVLNARFGTAAEQRARIAASTPEFKAQQLAERMRMGRDMFFNGQGSVDQFMNNFIGPSSVQFGGMDSESIFSLMTGSTALGRPDVLDGSLKVPIGTMSPQQLIAASGARNVGMSGPPKAPSFMDRLGGFSGKIGAGMNIAGGVQDFAKSQGFMGSVGSGMSTGAMIGSVVPVIGTAVGAVVGAIAGAVKGLVGPSSTQKAGREADTQIDDLRNKLVGPSGIFKSLTDLEAAASKVGMTFTDVWQRRGVDGLKLLQERLTEFQKKQDETTLKLQEEQSARDKLQAAVERYGFTIEELGPKWREQKLREEAEQLIEDFTILTASGIDVETVIGKMGDKINTFVQTAVKTGTEIPEAMRPMLQKMVDMGTLVDDTGKKIDSLDDLKFGMTMSQGFQAVIDKLEILIGKITGDLGKAIDNVPQPKIVGTVTWNVEGVHKPHVEGAGFEGGEGDGSGGPPVMDGPVRRVNKSGLAWLNPGDIAGMPHLGGMGGGYSGPDTIVFQTEFGPMMARGLRKLFATRQVQVPASAVTATVPY